MDHFILKQVTFHRKTRLIENSVFRAFETPHKRDLTAFQMLCKPFANSLQILGKYFKHFSNPLQTPVKRFAKRVKRFSNPLQMLLKPFSNTSQTLC